MTGQTVAEGVVLVSADAKNVPRDIARDVDSDQGKVTASGERTGRNLFAGVAKFAVGTATVVGAAIGGLAIKGGFDRALSIQDATKKLEGLGHDTTAVASIMTSALNSVRGTAFGLGAAATTSASLVAAGVGLGDELERRLKTVADTATIAGRSMEDVGTIFGSVAAKGKLQGDDLLQLMSSGVPVLQFLAQHLGTTSEEISKMVTRGEIDFATFADAMEEGIGGAALRGGETARGAFANVMAALGRLGAAFVTPAVAGAPGVFTAISGAIDGVAAALKPVSDAFSAWLTPALENVATSISSIDWQKLVEGVKTFSPLLTALSLFEGYSPIIQAWGRDLWPTLSTAFKDVADALAPILPMLGKELADSIVELAPSFIDLINAVVPLVPTLVDLAVKALPPILDLLELIVPPLSSFIGFIADLIEPLDSVIALFTGEMSFEDFVDGIANGGGALEDMYNWVKNLGAEFAPTFTTIMTIVGIAAGIIQGGAQNIATAWTWLSTNVITPVATNITNALTTIGIIFQALYNTYVKPSVDAIGTGFNWVWTNVIMPVGNAISNAVRTIGTTFTNTFGPIAGVIGGAFQGALSAAKGPINGLIGLINGAIRGLNKISVTIPDWVPAVGGQTWGLSLPTIPMLANGGVIRTGGRVLVGERGPEFLDLPRGAQVTPLNRPDALPSSGGDAPFIGGDLNIYESSDPLGSAGRLAQMNRMYRKTR